MSVVTTNSAFVFIDGTDGKIKNVYWKMNYNVFCWLELKKNKYGDLLDVNFIILH
jgi:hypothetical protein